MPILVIYGVPIDEDGERLDSLEKALQETVASMSELKISAAQVKVRFPQEIRSKNYRDSPVSEINAFVEGLFHRPERTDAVRNYLAKFIGGVLKEFFPHALVECIVKKFEEKQGFWSSAG